MTIKSIISFLISCLSITALLAQNNGKTQFFAKNEPDGAVIITIEVGGVAQHRIGALGEAVKVKVNEGTPLLVSGAPDIEKLNASIQIPFTGKMAVEVLAADFVETEAVEVAPSKGNLSRKVNPSDVPFTYGEAYQTDAFYPGVLAEVKHTFIMRDVRGQAMWFYPVQYNPVTKKLRTYTNMTIKVHKTAETGDNEILAPKQRARSKSFQNLYKSTFINYTDQTAVERNELWSEPEKMLVICKDDFQEAMAPLVEWKRQMGIHTTVVPTSVAGTTAADVLAYVTAYYEAHDISYLLLVGDQEAIYPEFRGSYSCDNCFGYMSGDDHYPEVMVGRFNAETVEQVELMVMRNLEYEKNPVFEPSSSWCNTALAAASNEGAGIGDDDQADFEHANEWKTKHLDATYAKYFEFYDGNHAAISPTPGDESADENGNPSPEDIVALMNSRGVSLYNYTGHGWEQGLVSGNFSTTAVADLRNVHKYPFMIAVACCAGNFTNNSDGDCLGEAAQRAGNAALGEPYGVIGGLFSSDFQSWSPPMEGQDAMNFLLTKADSMQVRPTFGEIMTYGNFNMIAAYDQGGEEMADYWNPFLEPTTVIRTDNPQNIVANIPAQAYLGQSEMTVTSAVEGALVGVYFQGQTLASGTIENGQAVLNFPALANAGDLVVTISHFNFAPLQQILSVVPLSGPFIVQQQMVLDDAIGGNNNAKADFSETIKVNLTLANIGLSQAHNVQTSLVANDAYITIVDGTETWGNIEDSTDLAKTGVFSFEVEDSISNNHVVNFQLIVTYDDTTNLVVNLPVTLQAPVLEVLSIQVNDATGNNNGRLDANETAIIQVMVKNAGKAASPLAVGELLSNSALVTVQAPISLGNLPANGAVTTVNFGVTVSPTVPQNHAVIFDFKAEAMPYSAAKATVLLINPIVEDFETGAFEAFEWQMQGNKPWITTTQTPFAGTTCSRSGAIANNQKSIMTLNLNILEEGQVSFARKVSSEENYDYLRFSIDGLVQASWSGEEDWEVATFPIGLGMHTLSWTYEKDEYATGGQDRAWVDDIFLPAFEVEVATSEPTLSTLQVRAIPNPTRGGVAIQYTLDQSQGVKIELYDLNGKMVQDILSTTVQSAGSYSQSVDLQDFSAGVYLVKVRSDKGSNTIKVVKL